MRCRSCGHEEALHCDKTAVIECVYADSEGLCTCSLFIPMPTNEQRMIEFRQEQRTKEFYG